MIKGAGKGIALRILPFIFSWILRCWFATCRVKFHGEENRRQAEERGKPIIGTAWHYCVLGFFGIFRDEPFVFMVSASHDGDYLSKLAKHLGFSVVRGSRNNKGSQAVKELIRELRRGKNAGLIADGSQGPPMKVQPGAILLASRTEGAILPVLWSASRYIAFKSWDRMILPVPFSRVDFFYGEPYLVPKGLKPIELDEYKQTLEVRLSSLYKRAWEVQGKLKH